MPAATVTIRELKNKDTGIDLSVPTYKEIKGILGSSFEYHVMVVSNLSYFKTAKHKETDHVQFMIPKKFHDFEELYTKMNTKYCGTAFPPLPKKVLLMNDAIAKERRSGLEYIMKFLAMTPKLCTCSLLLEFLGVTPMKAGRMKSMEVSDKIVAEQDKPPETEAPDELGTEKQELEQTENLFDDENTQEEDDMDMFSVVPPPIEEDYEDDTKIFDDQDLGGGIDEGEADDLFLTDARLDSTQATDRQETVEDNSDLFQIDDDIEKIMTLDLKSKQNLDDIDNRTDETGDTFSAMIDLPDQSGAKDSSVTDTVEPDESGDKNGAMRDSAELDKTEDKDSVATNSAQQDQICDKDGATTYSLEEDQTGDKDGATTDSGKLDQTSDRNSAAIEIPKQKPIGKPEVKSKPNIPRKSVDRKVSEETTEMDFDEIVAKAEIVESVSARPKPAPRKKPVNKDRPYVPKRPEISKDKPNVPVVLEGAINKPSVPKRPETVKDKPNVPKRPEIAKDKPNVPKGPEVVKDKPKVPNRPEDAAKPKIADKPKVIAESTSDKTDAIENIKEDDILKYIQENTTSEDDVDLFS